jgi:lipopolysaccharide export LptBFGC system permease protein LptF
MTENTQRFLLLFASRIAWRFAVIVTISSFLATLVSRIRERSDSRTRVTIGGIMALVLVAAVLLSALRALVDILDSGISAWPTVLLFSCCAAAICAVALVRLGMKQGGS